MHCVSVHMDVPGGAGKSSVWANGKKFKTFTASSSSWSNMMVFGDINPTTTVPLNGDIQLFLLYKGSLQNDLRKIGGGPRPNCVFVTKMNIFNFNHIDPEIEEETLPELKLLNKFYHKRWWCYKKLYARYKRDLLLTNRASSLLVAIGTVAGESRCVGSGEWRRIVVEDNK